jgi:TusE/DsrC/DsvC family sulfur relay protein
MRKTKVVADGRTYEIDQAGCLKRFSDWTPAFAEAMASEADIQTLTEAHWQIIRYLRTSVEKNHRTPIVHRTVRDNGLSLRALERLFPTGYHRGACMLAGINSFGVYPDPDSEPKPSFSKTYRIDGGGFLVDPGEWDESFAAMRAEELGVQLTARHWEVLRFVRNSHASTGKVPTVFEMCKALKLEAQELETLFPPGYHRGAIKLAGLSLGSEPSSV